MQKVKCDYCYQEVEIKDLCHYGIGLSPMCRRCFVKILQEGPKAMRKNLLR